MAGHAHTLHPIFDNELKRLGTLERGRNAVADFDPEPLRWHEDGGGDARDSGVWAHLPPQLGLGSHRRRLSRSRRCWYVGCGHVFANGESGAPRSLSQPPRSADTGPATARPRAPRAPSAQESLAAPEEEGGVRGGERIVRVWRGVCIIERIVRLWRGVCVM